MTESKPTWRIIDPHVHVWKNDPQYPWPPENTDPPSQDALPEQLLALMEENGVEKTVIVHPINYLWDCRYTGDTIQGDRKHFMGVCRVNPEAESAADDLSRWVSEYGYHGVRLSPFAGEQYDWINDQQQMDRIWNRTAELKIPMCILCDTARLPDVERVIQRHEGLDVSIDHMADCPIDRPEELEKLLALARYPRVYVKISHLWELSQEEYPYRDTWGMVSKVYDAFGPQRLMWGTDWPLVDNYCGYGRAVELYRDHLDFLNDDDRRCILSGTALKLWDFGGVMES